MVADVFSNRPGNNTAPPSAPTQRQRLILGLTRTNLRLLRIIIGLVWRCGAPRRTDVRGQEGVVVVVGGGGRARTVSRGVRWEIRVEGHEWKR